MYDDENGFTHVSKKNKLKKPSNNELWKDKKSNYKSEDESDDNQFEQLTYQQLEKIVKFYEKKANKFIQTNYFQNFKKLYNDLMNGNYEFDQVICYGLGNFNKKTISRKQLYFLICLKLILKCNNWQIYDPVFNLDEQTVLKKLGFNLIETNEYCRRSIEEDNKIKKTLFYMPHCHKFMYNNLFWANWNLKQLSNLYLIGNSFKLCSEELLDKNDLKEFAYIHSLRKLKVVQEFEIKNSYSNILMFNDLSFHIFKTDDLKPTDLLELFDPQFPVYRNLN